MNRIILFILIINNILNLILDRDGHEGGRGAIYVANGAALILMSFSVIVNKKQYLHFFSWIKLFMIIFLINLVLQFIYLHNPYFALGQYVRFFMSLMMFLYFFKFPIYDNRYDIYFKIFVLTYILQCCSKILLGHWFVNSMDTDNLTGGDTVSMGLSAVIPLIFMFYKDKQSLILLCVCFLFICFSLRRSALLSFVISIPFIWKSIKPHISKSIMFILFFLLMCVFIIAWKYVGPQLVIRLWELIDGIEGLSEGEAYGSGRTDYWISILNEFVESDNYLFGHGMGSVYEFYSTHNLYVLLPHAHNDFIEILYTFGIIGLFFWCMYFFRIAQYAFKQEKTNDRNLLVCSLAIYTFIGFTSGIILRTEFFPCVIAIALLINKIQTQRLQLYIE